MLGIRTFAIATGPISASAVVARSADEPGMFALAYHGLRDAMDAAMVLDAGARTFVDGPNIVSFSLDADGNAQAPEIRVGLDIWDRDHGFLPLTGPSLTAPEAELVAGVTDHIAERFALEGLAGAPGGDRLSIGVGEIFEAAATEGIRHASCTARSRTRCHTARWRRASSRKLSLRAMSWSSPPSR